MAPAASAIAILAVIMGLVLSWNYDTPVGPSVVISATVAFGLSLFVRQKLIKNPYKLLVNGLKIATSIN